jgi:hypothetical protein
MLTGTVAESSSIVSISVQLKHNIDAVNEYVVKRIPIPLHDFTSDPRLIVIRSFDVSKPGAEVDGLKAAWQAGRSRQAYCDLVWKSRLAHYSPGMAKDSTGRNRLPADILAHRLAARRDESAAVRGAWRAHRRREEYTVLALMMTTSTTVLHLSSLLYVVIKTFTASIYSEEFEVLKIPLLVLT